MSWGFAEELRVVYAAGSLARWSRGDAIGVSRVSGPAVSGCCFGVVVLGRRWPGHPRSSGDLPFA